MMYSVALLLCSAQASQFRPHSGQSVAQNGVQNNNFGARSTFMQEEQPPADTAAAMKATIVNFVGGGQTPGGQQYNHDEFNKEWHGEWQNGNYPGYKITNPEATKHGSDYQSDGKPNKIPPSLKSEQSGSFHPLAFVVLGSLIVQLAL
eukprot:gnl/MRDRNA2_/MRDRNA2_89378_c0_seq1.p1 gnl/MRDRNA2_/MRDRNA2_89378_c0~~gnl/MRDRNA2_/MRDRNA2_89378_c0_seq1.p1  ORF type:complete len:148 (+),score=33.86 gnl/MRDRNA2_/MRDRNA2_89378_c0_seq1:112-555(+)